MARANESVHEAAKIALSQGGVGEVEERRVGKGMRWTEDPVTRAKSGYQKRRHE